MSEPWAAPLACAPRAPVSADGVVAYGTYQGLTGPIDWSPLRRATGRRAGSWKRWHYIAVAGPDAVAAAAVVDLGWTSSAFAYLFDRRRRALAADHSALGLPRRTARVSDRPGAGATTTFDGRRTRVRLERGDGGAWRLSVSAPGLVLDALAAEAPDGATLCAIAPVPGGIVDCTHKTPRLRVLQGRAVADDVQLDLAGCSAAIDHTSGLLARETEWHWASACGPGVALNLTQGFTAPAENALWVGGRIERIGPVSFAYDRTRPEDPWRIMSADGAVDLTFTPEGRRREDRNLVLAVSRYVQPIGTFAGCCGGQRFDGLVGVTEHHLARW
ncbi:MAG TPA: DUF2804 domain-containing protein [Acidimicrobiales bacterium]|nr:DUF2804 domain-containing protein [Acidimicrobiales bacterium]